MIPNSRMLVSAAVVGVVLVGGVTVAATAGAERLDKAVQTVKLNKVSTKKTEPTPEAEPYVVSREVSGDPFGPAEFWTPDRLEKAEPMPIPEVSISIKPGN